MIHIADGDGTRRRRERAQAGDDVLAIRTGMAVADEP